jgi:hypothetical protein
MASLNKHGTRESALHQVSHLLACNSLYKSLLQ